MAKRSIIGPIILIGIFVVPLAGYFFLKLATSQQFNKMPFVYQIQENGDTVYYRLPVFHFQSLDGDSVSGEALLGNICLLGFFSPEGEPMVNTAFIGNLKRTFDNIAWERSPDIRFALFCEKDTTGKLRAYVDSLDVNPDQWMFLTASAEALQNLAEEGLGITDFTSSGKPFSSGLVVLTDKEGRVRKKYNATNLIEERKIQEDLITLLRLEYGL
ncbi:MAG: hypothetical protein R3C61_05775 [Bacteroidia bacterium]